VTDYNTVVKTIHVTRTLGTSSLWESPQQCGPPGCTHGYNPPAAHREAVLAIR